MASILGIELDRGVGRHWLGQHLVRVWTDAHPDWNANVIVYDRDQDDFPMMRTRAFGDTESEAIAALEAKVKRLPGVLAVLNGGTE